MTRYLFPTLAVFFHLSANPAGAQVSDRASFVTRLGDDTIAVEQFARSSDRIEGIRVLRAPRTSVIQYSAILNEDGSVRQFSAAYRLGGELDAAPRWTSITDFTPRMAVTRFTSGLQTDTIRIPTESPAMPMLMHSYALYEQVVRRAKRTGGKKVRLALVYPGQRDAGGTWVSPVGGDSVAINYFHEDAARARIDGEGRILGLDARSTVLKVVVTRGDEMDVLAPARQFAARDAAGQGLGAISPSDSVHATVGVSRILVEYNRPSKRGRVIFGGLVPYDQVWRTGADAATHFTTSSDIRVGSTVLRAGSYTLWTIPGRSNATLIINSQTGQWGTEYDHRRDFARIPLEVRQVDQPVERFTISIVPAANGGSELRFNWDQAEWAVSLSAPQ
jgi:hypothetical protein